VFDELEDSTVVLWIDELEDLAVEIGGFVPPVHDPQFVVEDLCFVHLEKTSPVRAYVDRHSSIDLPCFSVEFPPFAPGGLESLLSSNQPFGR